MPKKPLAHILVVEDDLATAKVLTTRLRSWGYQVHAETRGIEALHYAAEHRPELVLLDLRLPDMHGFDVCHELRKLYHPWDVSVLMLTGMDRPMDELQGFAHGADAYLTKPYKPNELQNAIKLLLQETIPAE